MRMGKSEWDARLPKTCPWTLETCWIRNSGHLRSPPRTAATSLPRSVGCEINPVSETEQNPELMSLSDSSRFSHRSQSENRVEPPPPNNGGGTLNIADER